MRSVRKLAVQQEADNIGPRWETLCRCVPTRQCEASQLCNDYLICLTCWHFGLFKLKELALQQTPAHDVNLPFIFRKRRHTKGSSVCAPLFIMLLSLFLKIVFMSTTTNVWCEFCSRKDPSRSAALMSFLFASEAPWYMPAFSRVIDKQVIWMKDLFVCFFVTCFASVAFLADSRMLQSVPYKCRLGAEFIKPVLPTTNRKNLHWMWWRIQNACEPNFQFW